MNYVLVTVKIYTIKINMEDIKWVKFCKCNINYKRDFYIFLFSNYHNFYALTQKYSQTIRYAL